MNRLIWPSLFVIGVLIALVGIGIDFLLPGTSPGVNLPQLLLIAFGLMLSLAAHRPRFLVRLARAVQSRRSKSITVILALGTLAILELAIGATGALTYTAAATMPDVASYPYFKCDNNGCNLAYDVVVEACQNGQQSGRICTVNRQGFLGPHEFAPLTAVELRDSERILMLGDSFTYGLSADMGKSYVETLQAKRAGAIVWNTGFAGTGTVQALSLYTRFAPMLRPQLTILGFVSNDFSDNLLALKRGANVIDASGRRYMVASRYLDRWGNLRTAEVLDDRPYVSRTRGPANDLEMAFGRTQLGSLLLRALDMAANAITAPRVVELETEHTRNYLRELRDKVADSGGDFLILLVPHAHDIPSPSERFQRSSRLIEELGIPYINPMALLDSVADYVAPPDGHWNNSGHQKVGELLSDCVERFLANGDFSDCAHITLP